MYTIIIMGSLLSSLFDTIFVVIGFDKIGVTWLYNIGAIASFISLIITLCFKEELDVDNLDRRGLLEWTPALPNEQDK